MQQLACEQLIVRAPNFPNDGCIGREGMENLLRILKDNGPLGDADASVDRYVDRRWCAS